MLIDLNKIQMLSPLWRLVPLEHLIRFDCLEFNSGVIVPRVEHLPGFQIELSPRTIKYI